MGIQLLQYSAVNQISEWGAELKIICFEPRFCHQSCEQRSHGRQAGGVGAGGRGWDTQAGLATCQASLTLKLGTVKWHVQVLPLHTWAATVLCLGPWHQDCAVGGGELERRVAGPEMQVVCDSL